MESKIKKVLEKSFPEAFMESAQSGDFSEYNSLRMLCSYALNLIREKKKEQISELFEIIDDLYHFGTLHERNAIENEFLDPLAKEVKEESLREHLKLMPKTLKSVYIKTIIEN